MNVFYKEAYENVFPFQVSLQNAPSHKTLTCTTLVRHLPKKRLSCQAVWGGKPVFVKIFFPKGRRAFHKEYRNTQKLTEKNILTQTILYAGEGHICLDPPSPLTPLPPAGEGDFSRTLLSPFGEEGLGVRGGEIHILVFALKEGTKTFKEAWQEASHSQKSSLFSRLLETLAELHQAGVRQTDFHLSNFLICQQEIITIDAATLRFLPSPLQRPKALSELGFLLAQFSPHEEEFTFSRLPPYFQKRGWEPSSPHEKTTIKQFQSKWRDHIWHTTRKKIFRTTTRFQCLKNWKRTVVWDKNLSNPTLLDFLQDPPAFLNNPSNETKILKKASSRTTLKLQNGHPLFIKHYPVKSFWNILRSIGRPTKAETSWKNAHYLSHCGISTPRPIAYVQYQSGPFKRSAYLVTERMDMSSIWEPLTNGEPNTVEKIVLAVCQMLMRMKKFQISHGDFKISNVVWEPKREEVMLVDLDNLKQHRFKWTFKKAFASDIQRLHRDLANTPHPDLFRKAFLENGLI